MEQLSYDHQEPRSIRYLCYVFIIVFACGCIFIIMSMPFSHLINMDNEVLCLLRGHYSIGSCKDALNRESERERCPQGDI